MTMHSKRIRGVLATLLLAAALPAAASQPPATDASPAAAKEPVAAPPLDAEAADPEVLEAELQTLLEQAIAAHQNGNWQGSVELSTRLLGELEARLAATPRDTERRLLIDGLLRRGEAHFMAGEAAEPDLRRAIELDPGRRQQREWSPRLDELYQRLIGELVGYVELLVVPPDAEVLIDGRVESAVEGPVALVAGERRLTVARPGHASREVVLEVVAGETQSLVVDLVRTAAVVELSTRPPGAGVYIDGELAATTLAPEEPAPGAEAAADEPRASRPLVLEVPPGPRRIEVRMPGFRSRLLQEDSYELLDYVFGELELEPARGTLELAGIPADSEVLVDEEPHLAGPGGALTLELGIGEHVVSVAAPALGRYEERVTLADGDAVRLAVRLRPVLALAGVVGGSRVDVPRLAERIAAVFEELEPWWFVADHRQAGEAVLADLGLDAARLRQLAAGEAELEGGWDAPRRRLAAAVPARVLLVAVPTDDIVADGADLWILSAAAASVPPVVRRVAFDDPDWVGGALAAFRADALYERPRLGARLLDAGAGVGVVVASVRSDGAAVAAGLEIGDRVLRVGGQEVVRSRQVAELVDRAERGAAIELGIERSGESKELTVTPRWSYAVPSPADPNLLPPVTLALTEVALAAADPAVPVWLVRLHRVAALVAAGDWAEAAVTLREARGAAPERAGLGRAMADYWLGVGYLTVDPAAYGERAREALERAASQRGGRLFHDDGPLVAPRARARLAELAPR